MLGAAAEVDAVALAQRIQRVGGAGVAAAGDGQRIDHARRIERRQIEPLQLRVEEAEIKFGVVRDQRGVADESQETLDDRGEFRLVRDEIVGDAVHVDGAGGNFALGVDVGVERSLREAEVVDLDRGDLDDAVAVFRTEAGGFRVEDDFPHGPNLPLAARRMRKLRAGIKPVASVIHADEIKPGRRRDLAAARAVAGF